MAETNSELLASLQSAYEAQTAAYRRLDRAQDHLSEVLSRDFLTERAEGSAEAGVREANSAIAAAVRRIDELKDAIEAQTGQRPN